MLDWLKTSSGAYNLTFIVALVGWAIGGIGLIAGFHLNKLKTVEAETKAKTAETDRATIAGELETARARTAELERKLAPRQLTPKQRSACPLSRPLSSADSLSTAIVRGKHNTTGVALVEAYQLDN